MPPTTTRRDRPVYSLTLPRDLVGRADAAVSAGQAPSRSALVEVALRAHLDGDTVAVPLASVSTEALAGELEKRR